MALWWLITLDESSIMTAFGQTARISGLVFWPCLVKCVLAFVPLYYGCCLWYFLGVFHIFWACPSFLPPSFSRPMFPRTGLLQDRPDTRPPDRQEFRFFSVLPHRKHISQVPLKSRVKLLVPRIPNSSGIHSATRVVLHSANPSHRCLKAGTTVEWSLNKDFLHRF